MSIRNTFAMGAVTCVIGTAGIGISTSACASDTGAFIGGVFATKLISNSRRRADAEETQAAVAVQQSQAPARKSPEQRIKELDDMAAKGYITPAEYKAKKKAILDSM